VLLAAAACGGEPGDRSLSDGASAPTAKHPDAGPSPGATCWGVEEGCSCADWGATVSCKSVVLDFGDYVTCAGTRECVRGVWGPCVPPHFVPR
jgi:hypothetical protein